MINITQLLPLNVDQHNKLEANKKCNCICSIHLDDYNKPNQVNPIVEILKSMSKHSPISIILFTSPQRHVDFKQYRDMIPYLMSDNILQLLCIDGVQLLTQF